MTPPRGVGDAAPYNTIRRASHYRKRPRRPGGRPPYIPLYHIPWGGPSSATHSHHPVGGGHARPATLPLPPRILCIVGRQATGPLHNRPAPSNIKITCLRPLAGRLQRVEKPPSAREVPRRGGGREPCHSPKYFGQPYSSLPHRLRAEPPRRGGQGVSTPFSTACNLPAASRRQVIFSVPFLLRKGTNPRLVKITSGQSPQPRRPAPAGPAGSARPSGR